MPSDQGNFGYYYFDFVPPDKQAYNCIKCGACKLRCPQGIDIPVELMRVHTVAAIARLGVDATIIPKQCENKKVVLFGSGALGKSCLKILSSLGVDVYAYCDNNEKIWNTFLDGIRIISPTDLEKIKNNTVVFISSTYYEAIAEQLCSMNIVVLN